MGRKQCMLHQCQWRLLFGWKCCSLLMYAAIDGATALLLFYHRGIPCDALSKAWLESSPVLVGRFLKGANTQPNCRVDKEEGNFLRDPEGSEWSWYNSKCHWKLVDWEAGWDFLCNAQKAVFPPSYLQLFQAQWGCWASRKTICLPPGHQIQRGSCQHI